MNTQVVSSEFYTIIFSHIDGYNRYLEVIGYPIHTDTNGSANKETKIFKIEDGTKFIYFLSAETTGESRYQGSDLLFCVIDQLVSFLFILRFVEKLLHILLFFTLPNRLPLTMVLFGVSLVQLPLQNTLV